MPGTSSAYAWNDLPVGMLSMTSRSMTCRCSTFWMSTTGVAPETVIVSSMSPIPSWMSILAVKPLFSTTPSRSTEPNPGREYVTS